MRRIAFAGLVVAVLAAGLVGLTAAARPGAIARAAGVARPARRALVAPAVTGSTCYIGVPECSETPCVEFARGAQAAVLVVPGVRRAPQPTTRCPDRGRRSVPSAVPAGGAVIQAIPAGPAHRLTSRGP